MKTDQAKAKQLAALRDAAIRAKHLTRCFAVARELKEAREAREKTGRRSLSREERRLGTKCRFFLSDFYHNHDGEPWGPWPKGVPFPCDLVHYCEGELVDADSD
jgi:hypothetical protein